MSSNFDMMKRLIYVDHELRKPNRKINCNDIAVHFEMERKTALKVIDYMKEELQAPIEYDPKLKTYYYTDENYNLPAINLTEGELFSLLVAEKALKLYENTPYDGDLKRVFEKISKFLPNRIKYDPDDDVANIKFGIDVKTEINKEVYDAVSLALKDRRELEIVYYAITKEQTQKRTIHPYYLIRKHGDWYIIAYCTLRKDIRTFALHRIKEAKVLDGIFSIEEEIDIKTLGENGLDIVHGRGSYEVEIRVEFPRSLFIAEKKWHSTQKIKENKDRSINISLTVNSLQEVKRWVLSMGGNAKVIKPKLLFDEVQAEVKAMYKKYK